MTIVGIYWVDEADYQDGPAERAYERMAAFDTERGVWLASSDGRTTDEFDPEELVDASAAEVLQLFADRFDGSRGTHVIRESDVPGEVDVLEPLVEPSVEIVEQNDR